MEGGKGCCTRYKNRAWGTASPLRLLTRPAWTAVSCPLPGGLVGWVCGQTSSGRCGPAPSAVKAQSKRVQYRGCRHGGSTGQHGCRAAAVVEGCDGLQLVCSHPAVLAVVRGADLYIHTCRRHAARDAGGSSDRLWWCGWPDRGWRVGRQCCQECLTGVCLS